ncbi:MAG: PAS domain S-box protein [Acidimicrobiales bacterium]
MDREHSPSDLDTRAVSSELLGAVISLMPDAVVIVDASGYVASANAQAEALFGYSPGSLVGLSIEALVPERVRPRHRQHRSDYLAAPEKRPMGAGLELVGRRCDGGEFPVDISLGPIESSGEPLIVAAVRDVTEQRAATAAQAELATIVRSSLDAIISTTLEGQITNWNPAAEELLGYGPEQIIGRHIATLVPGQSSIVLEELLDAAYNTSHRGARDTRWRHRDGHEIDVAVSISPLRDQTGALRGFSSIVRDVTERKLAETELRRLLAEEELLERQHAATAEIRLALLSGMALNDSLKLICERASELIDSPVVVICVKEKGETHITAAVGLPLELTGMRLPENASFAERVIESRELTEIARRTDVSTVELPDSLPDGPTLGIPILAVGAAAASLTFVRSRGASVFSQSDRLFAEAVAAQAALAFEFDRSRRDREEMMLIEDRERIARDLHDNVIQQLFALGLSLQATQQSATGSTAERLDGAVDVLDGVIREIRNTIFEANRRFRASPGIQDRVRVVIQEMTAPLGFTPRLRILGVTESAVSDHIADHMLAVLRESLSNISRHARASRADVVVEISQATLKLSVSDDGVGFPSDPTAGNGLANMTDRALRLGGSFTAKPRCPAGTLLEWEVPLEKLDT